MQVKNLQSPTKQAKFKIGDFVANLTGSHFGKVVDLFYYPIDDCWIYCVNNNATMYNESHLQLMDYPENGAINESATKTGTEQQFKIGKSYSFTDRDGIEWQGKLLSVIDHKYKYIALIDGSDIPAAFDQIKPLQPRKVSRWINVCPDGRVLRKSYETEQEARDKACQGGMADCRQVKLEGVI